jgi:hypothetical protein
MGIIPRQRPRKEDQLNAAGKRSDALEQYYFAGAWREKLPLKQLRIDDPRARVALSSVRAAGSQPARSLLDRWLSDLESRRLDDTSPPCLNAYHVTKYNTLVFSISSVYLGPRFIQLRCRSRGNFLVLLHAALQLVELPFHKPKNGSRSYPCLCILRTASFISLALGAMNPWR